MPEPFVPIDFSVPEGFTGPGFRLEPLGPEHNERDYEAWTSSMGHIRATPGFTGRTWPEPMAPDQNLEDLEMHAREFIARTSFTYSILDGDDVVGCVYIYPGGDGFDADVRSWVTQHRADLDTVVWRVLTDWLTDDWPFRHITYATREG